MTAKESIQLIQLMENLHQPLKHEPTLCWILITYSFSRRSCISCNE